MSSSSSWSISCLDHADNRRGAWMSEGVASGSAGSHGDGQAEQLISGMPAFSSADWTLGSRGRRTGPRGGAAELALADPAEGEEEAASLALLLLLFNFDESLESIVCCAVSRKEK